MELKIKDIVTLLNVSEKTVYKWIKENKIPCYKINHQYRFNRPEINEWLLSNKVTGVSTSSLNLNNNPNTDSFAKILERGGIISNIKGENVREVFKNAIDKIFIPPDLSKDELFEALISREELMPTAIGHGIAIPHPRTPVITVADYTSVSICYLEAPFDFGALDGHEVHTIFILLTESPRRHLDVLSKISYLCQDDVFLNMLKNQSEKEQILEYVREKELDWTKKENKV
ncbi:MAG: PTS sugar transporter subunit IIA [Candidatus Kapaibacterium sp.]